MTVGTCGTVANDNARLHVQQILTAEGLLLRRDQLLKPELNQPQGCSSDLQSGPVTITTGPHSPCWRPWSAVHASDLKSCDTQSLDALPTQHKAAQQCHEL